MSLSSRSFVNWNITIKPMQWLPGGEREAKDYGATASPGAPSVDATRGNVLNVLRFVSLESEAGCRILVNVLLIHLASSLETDQTGLAIAPEARAEEKTSIPITGEDSPRGLVDYMLVYGDKAERDRVIQSSSFAFTDPNIRKRVKCGIYEAHPEALSNPTTALSRAAMAATLKARWLGLRTFRGCVTSGKWWLFFIYNADQTALFLGGGTVHWLEALPLGERNDATANLELILGVLRDWVEHGHDKDLRFFKYTE